MASMGVGDPGHRIEGARLAQDRIVGQVSLDAAALAAAAERAAPLHLHVPELGPDPAGAAIEPAVDDDAHTHAVLDCNGQKVRQPLAVAEPLLGQRGQVGVVVDEDGPAEAQAHQPPEIDLLVAEDRAPLTDPGGTVDEARQCDADAVDLLEVEIELGDRLAQRIVDHRRDLVGRAAADHHRHGLGAQKIADELLIETEIWCMEILTPATWAAPGRSISCTRGRPRRAVPRV